MMKVVSELPDDFDLCLALSLRKANRVMSQVYDHHLAEYGLKGSQFAILRATNLLQKTTNKQLQEVLVLDQTTLSRGLKPLIRDGLIVSQEGEDRRVKELKLTKAGQTLFAKALINWKQAQSEMKGKLGGKNTAMLHALSHTIVNLKH